MDQLQIEYVDISEVKPYANNAKIHTDEQINQIIESIKLFGMNDPIAVWKDGEIIEGHGRLIACEKLGMKKIPVIRLDSLTDEQRRAYMNIHNQLTMNTGFDLDLLTKELGKIENIDMNKFSFNLDDFLPERHEWFDERKQNDTSRQEGNDEYNDFLEKFEDKKTTDDCYTPNNIYEAIADYVAEHYKLDRKKFIRPFYPGGDYQNEKYPAGGVVVDNPPFSILSEIVRFYSERNIPFFLFAPSLTIFSGAAAKTACAVIVSVGITYENGATVATSFITSLEPDLVTKTDPELHRIVKEQNDINTKSDKEVPQYSYPPEVCTAAMLQYLSKYGIYLEIKRSDAFFIRMLDAQKEYKKGLFGSGFLLSEKAAAEKAAAEKAAAEKKLRYVWELSDRELEIVRSLG